MVDGLFLGCSVGFFILTHNNILDKEDVIVSLFCMFLGIFYMWLAFKEVKPKCLKNEKAGL